MTRTTSNEHCSHLTNNCLYFINFHLETGTQDAIVDTVMASFDDQAIEAAFVSLREVIPESEIKDRSVKKKQDRTRVTDMLLWFKAAKNIHVFPEDPYSLPSLMSANSNSELKQAVAAKTSVTSPSIETTKEAGLSDDLTKMKNQLEEMKYLQKDILATFKNLRVMSDQLIQPPRPSICQQNSGFPLTTASSSDVGDSDHKNDEEEEGEENSSTQLYAEALKSYTKASKWQTAPVRKKKNKPHLNRVDTHQLTNNNTSAQRRYEKRCHVVIHNLHSSVTIEDIKNRVIMITGSDPLILQALPCKARGQVAYRVSCHFQHLEVLIGENFGPTVKVSFYNLKRDQPRPPSPSVLGPMPSRQDLNPSVPSPEINQSPATSQESISLVSQNEEDHIPSSQDISSFLSLSRTVSD